MEIVECQMCFDLVHLTSWKDSDIFICKICVKILSEMKQDEIKLGKRGIIILKSFKLALFDMKREDIRERGDKK